MRVSLSSLSLLGSLNTFKQKVVAGEHFSGEAEWPHTYSYEIWGSARKISLSSDYATAKPNNQQAMACTWGFPLLVPLSRGMKANNPGVEESQTSTHANQGSKNHFLQKQWKQSWHCYHFEAKKDHYVHETRRRCYKKRRRKSQGRL